MGAGACVVIIEGERGLAAIADYNASHIPHKANTNYLAGQIEASCELASFVTLYQRIEETEIPDSDYEPIIAIHKKIAANILRMQPEEIIQAGIDLELANREFASKYS